MLRLENPKNLSLEILLPFTQKFIPILNDDVCAGLGLEHPTVGLPSHFVLTTLHPDGTPFTRGGEHVSVTISGPSSSPIDVPHSVHDNEDGTYTIHILCPRKVNMKFTYNLEN